MKIFQKEKGFTLIELLVVIAIIGILVAILFVAINPKEQTDKAKIARAVFMFNEIDKALGLYYMEHNHYPQIKMVHSNDSDQAKENFKKILEDYLNFNMDDFYDPENYLFVYRGSPDYSMYAIALKDPTGRYGPNDGGFLNDYYEKGNLVQYCKEHYSGDNANWLPRISLNYNCRGGN